MRLCRAPIRCPSGGGGGTREARGTVADILVGRSSRSKLTMARSIGRVSTRFGEGGGKPGRLRARGELNPCERESKEQIGSFLKGKLICHHGLFS